MASSRTGIRGDVYVVLENIHTGERTVQHRTNIVTTRGLIHYAEEASQGLSTNTTFDTLAITLASNAHTGTATSDFSDINPNTNGTKTVDGTYPQTNDSDTDNPGTVGSNVLTYRAQYGTADANDATNRTISVHASGASGSDPIIMVASLDLLKTSSQTAKVYVNHTFEDDGM